MFKKEGDSLVPDTGWIEYLHANTPQWDVEKFKKDIGEMENLRLQEPDVQNEFKLSFYLDNFDNEKDAMLQHIKAAVGKTCTNADVIYSVDPLKKIGLIDVLPKIATKVAALEYLRKELNMPKEDVVYCGDSGNDLLPLTFGYSSILMKNARPAIKEKAVRITTEKNLSDFLYISEGKYGLNGNYSSGILEGLVHFGIIDLPEGKDFTNS